MTLVQYYNHRAKLLLYDSWNDMIRNLTNKERIYLKKRYKKEYKNEFRK